MKTFDLVYIAEVAGQGVFGAMLENNIPFCVALTHAYGPDGLPIVRAGEYLCQLGTHALEDGVPFQTYEIKGIEGHSGLLFHSLNYESQSKGCIGLGHSFMLFGNVPGISESKAGFAEFMSRTGLDPIITLNVKEATDGYARPAADSSDPGAVSGQNRRSSDGAGPNIGGS